MKKQHENRNPKCPLCGGKMKKEPDKKNNKTPRWLVCKFCGYMEQLNA